MTIISAAIILFIFLEGTNIITMYFFPGSKKANAVGVFNAWEKSKADPEVHEFVRYLVNWIAGTKLIFIALLVVILFTGGTATKLGALIALILSILSFYWRLFPSIRAMDGRNEITPAGYSKSLGYMIAGFVSIFAVALIISLKG